MSEEEQLNSALNLMRRMPPSSTENSLAGLLELAPSLTDDLLTHVDQPLKVIHDTEADKPFVLCDYNRDGDSYRSPWSNSYFPTMDGFKPNKALRELEIEANKLFEHYTKLYFDSENVYSSAYLFETDEKDGKGFGACYLIHKEIDGSSSGSHELKKGNWDSIHVFEVICNNSKGTEFTYKLTTTVMVSLILQGAKIGTADLSGLRTQQQEKTMTMKANSQADHIKNMGQMLEDIETRIRNEIEGIYIQKTRTVISGMRGGSNKLQNQWGNIAQSLNQSKFHQKR